MERKGSEILPIWAIILLVIAGLLLVLLLSSVTLYLRYDEQLFLKVGILGFRFWLINPDEPEEDEESPPLDNDFSPKEKKHSLSETEGFQRKDEKSSAPHQSSESPVKSSTSSEKKIDPATGEKKKSTAKEKAVSLSEKHPKRDFSETVYFALDLLKALLPPAEELLSHVRITRLKVFISAGMEEADQTAYAYAAANTAVYYTLSVLKSLIRVKVKKIEIFADFVTGETRQFYSFCVKLRVCHLVLAAVRMLFRFLGMTKQREMKKQSPAENMPKRQKK